MAASNRENDYVHRLKYLMNKSTLYDDVKCIAINFSKWETHHNDRGEFLSDIDCNLTKDINLIILQLSDNITDYSTLEIDYDELIIYIKNKLPHATIISLGGFWENVPRDYEIYKACKKNAVDFIPLYDLHDKKYHCGIDNYVSDQYGRSHKIIHSGVASHPNDIAFRMIAEKIFESIVY